MLTNRPTLPTEYQQFIALSRYARWLDDKSRRETWEETVERYFDFFQNRLQTKFNASIEADRMELQNAVKNLDVMPSMRAMMTAGPALEKDNVAGYNCAYVAVDEVKCFAEILYILMCGTGVGFSAERQFVNKLPEVPDEIYGSDTVIHVKDSKIGWAKAFSELLNLLYSGHLPKWNTDKVRKAGAKLKTFGGRASGPEPLVDLFEFTVSLFHAARGRKLTSIEVHDLVCKIASIVVVGGVRRSALISLSNLSDDRMRSAKTGEWWNGYSHRALANNSACYTETPEIGVFMKEWKSLYDSKSGERGIFNREASTLRVQKTNAWRERNAARLGLVGDVAAYIRDPDWEWGSNPCCEIILRSKQFCNLSEIVARYTDTLEDLKRKARLAAILGTFQATLTDFRFLSPKWKRNTEEERLLGVSITGIMDHPVLNGSLGEEKMIEWLDEMRVEATKTNFEWAAKIGIPPAAAITCVKPSGTVSQLVDAASGIHSRHATHYIRRVRNDAKDPLSKLMIDLGFPYEVDKMNPAALVFSFPIRAPETAVTRDQETALKQLKIWEIYQNHWCDHKPSVTVSVREKEWMSVGAWVYEHFDNVSGVSFLPYDGGSYKQAPYEKVDEATLAELEAKMPRDVDWTKLSVYEIDDETTGMREFACVAGGCEL